MGQNKRLNISNDYNKSFESLRKQQVEMELESLSTLFAVQNNMGNDYSYRHSRHQQSASNFLSFFNRLGNYNVHNLFPTNSQYLFESKKMAALAIKFTIILANCFGLYLFFYWLFIDFAGIKVFLTSVGVFMYGGMKLYEKYLDIKKKKKDLEKK
jgi:hypothetical protein